MAIQVPKHGALSIFFSFLISFGRCYNLAGAFSYHKQCRSSCLGWLSCICSEVSIVVLIIQCLHG